MNHLLLFSVLRRTSCQRKTARKATPFPIRCEQSTQESSSLDVWLGRLAMVGFAVAISVEIATGKGLLEVRGIDIVSALFSSQWGYLTMVLSFKESDLQSLTRSYVLLDCAEFWAHNTPSYCCFGCYSISGSSNSCFHLPVGLKKLIRFYNVLQCLYSL